VNNKSRKVFVDDMTAKSEVAKQLPTFVTREEVQTGQQLKVLHSDGGGEYTSGEVQSFLKDRASYAR